MPNKISLQPYNTFGIKALASKIISIRSVSDLEDFFGQASVPNYLILGGGSNMLFTQDFEGVILLNQMLGITELSRSQDEIILKVSSGENWHQLVLYAVEKGYGGFENLSLIPGTVGAAPIQNIGAYGAEVKDTINEVGYFDIAEGREETIAAADCQFGYRDSIFKQSLKGKAFITTVSFKLSLNPKPNAKYEDVKDFLTGKENITVQDISDAVVAIRMRKLPNPAELGNAGSFFKNPIISELQFHHLLQQYPDIKGYPAPNGRKVAAGWLIEQCGWKGYRAGNAGVHERQALVLVNYANATGAEIYELSSKIVASVNERFGIELEREVQII